MIEDALIQHLLAQVPIAELVDRRIRPHMIPQEEDLPCITIERNIVGAERALDGPTNLGSPIFRIYAWASDWNVAQDIAEAVRAALVDTRRETWGDGVLVFGVEEEEGGDDEMQPIGLAYVVRDYRIWHRR